MRSRLRSAATVTIATVLITSVPVIAGAVPTGPPPPTHTCSAADQQELIRKREEIEARVAQHNAAAGSVDRTNVGAVNAYNAERDELIRRRRAINIQITMCNQMIREGRTGEPKTAPTVAPPPERPASPPSRASAPPVDGGNTSRGSSPLFMWVAVGTGNIADENGNISPQQAEQLAKSYGIPETVVKPGAFAQYRGRTIGDVISQYVDPVSGRWKWPENYGFAGEPDVEKRFSPRSTLDGFFDTDPASGLFDGDTAYENRALPPGTLGPYVKVVGTGKDLPPHYRLLSEFVASAFGMRGGDIKRIVLNTITNTLVSIRQLIAEGYLRQVN